MEALGIVRCVEISVRLRGDGVCIVSARNIICEQNIFFRIKPIWFKS